MGNTNTYVNNFLHDKDRFADLINGFVFRGRKVVKAEALRDVETKGWRVKANSEEIIRDQLKCWEYKGRTYMLGVEAEQNIQYAMPIRMLDYDAIQYRKEYNERRKKHRESKDLLVREYISGVSKKEQFSPVFSMVVYLGKEKWDAPDLLSQTCDLDGIPEEILPSMKELFNDYHVNIYDINALEDFDIFATDLREVFGFLRYQRDKVKLSKFISEHVGFRHMKVDAYQVISCLGNIKQLDIRSEKDQQEGEIDMCQAIEEMLNDAKAEGEREGIREGIREERIRQKKIKILFQHLVEDKRYEELAQATQQDAICEKLMLEYGI